MKRTTMAKDELVSVAVDLGDLKPLVQKVAKQSGVTMDEFLVNAIESCVRRGREYYRSDDFTRHGGKHLYGKHTGYEVADGKYYPAPTWVQQFELLFAERIAIHNLVSVLMHESEQRLIEVEKNIIKAKNKLVSDLGLDPSKNWVYYGGPDPHLEEQQSDAKPSQTVKVRKRARKQ